MRRKMITVSTALALMLSVAGCKDKAPEETMPETNASATTEAVNASAEPTTAAPVTTLATETTATPVTTTAADITTATATTAPETTAEETEAPEVSIPLTAEYFPDEAFCQLVSAFDQNKDGVLSLEERMAVKEIRCVNTISYTKEGVIPTFLHGPIYNLEGLKYFPALEVLECPYLGLTELDVSHNLELTYLFCQNNKLTTLDLSKNEALFQLDCHDNQLTSLNISSKQKLCWINCVANSMTELNLSGLTSLNIAECFCNPSLKVNAYNCSSPIKFCIDATASILGDSANFEILKRYDHVPLKDGYYFADLREKDWLDLEWEQSFHEYGFNTWMNSSFTEASVDQNTLRILDARLLSGSDLSCDFYDCGTLNLPLAQNVKFYYINIYGDKSIYSADDFNTFYSAMLDEYNSCFSEDTSGGLDLSIHISDGSVDEITINVDQYP